MNIRDKWNKMVDTGGEFIANKVFLQPSIDKWRGEQADRRLQQIKALRERRKEERHTWDREGNYERK